MNHTVSDIVATYLISQGILQIPGISATWPIYVGHLPGGKLQRQAAVITDTPATRDGRLMHTGEVIEHPNFQIRVRSEVYQTALLKLQEIATTFDPITNTTVVMGVDSYSIKNISRTSSIIPMGVEPETRLFLFSANFLITIKQI